MIRISEKRILQLKKNFKGKRIAVIGDMMLDIYYRGDVKRISPEAPVPVLEVENEFHRFGGAANVALNIAKLNGIPEPIGVIGYDSFGALFNSLLSEQNISQQGIFEDQSRPTTAKTRVIADSQHIVRIDKESKETINKKIQNEIVSYVKTIIKDLDGIILQDYNKGVLSSSLISQVIELANKNKKLITVDPKFNNFYEYKNVSVFKPNRHEAEDILGMKIKTDADVSFAGNTLLNKLNPKNILLTLGDGGIAVFEKGKPEKRMPTKARKIADVSGAGDTVISTLTIALAAGANIYEASYLANYAGGLVCEEVGIVPIEIEKLFDIVIRENK